MTTESYSQQGNRGFEAQMAARTAAEAAAFFVPHLHPGMRVLDVGCGPGSITLGLGEVVAPGDVVGLDLQPAQVEQARALAATRGADTVQFEVGTADALPFPNGSFDAVFAHAVVMHLREPLGALAEMHRVLRPGGLAGIRDPDWGSTLLAPTTVGMEAFLALRVRVRQHNGGDPFLGRHHRRLLLEAGFARAEASASVQSAGSSDETRAMAAWFRDQLEGFARTALAQGWMEQAEVDGMATQLAAWGERPDAFFASTWCQAIGWVGPV